MTEVARHVHTALEIAVPRTGDDFELRILQFSPGKKTRKFWILINVQGVRVVLFVHETFMAQHLEKGRANDKGDHIVDPLGFEGVAMDELMSASKGKALHLKAVEDVQREEKEEFLNSFGVGGEEIYIQGPPVEINNGVVGINIEDLDRVGVEEEKRHVGKEAFEAVIIRFLHELHDDAVR